MRPRGLFVGLATLDVVHVLDELPRRDEKSSASAQFVSAGGPAANAALTFAALGGDATLCTVLGRHPLAEIAAVELAAHGVQVLDADPDRELPPAVSAIRIDARSGDRSVSSADSTGPDAPCAPELPDADVVLLDGHWPTLAAAPLPTGVPVVVDAGRPRPIFAELFARADLVIASADYRPDPTHEALRAGAAAVAVTDGARPVRWATAEGTGSVQVPGVVAVDTLGAGDAFHGAAAHAVATVGGPSAVALLPKLLEYAVAVAGVRVGRLGPRDWLADPRLAELARQWN